ncbi:MAG: preprotein translocase subunit SecG [Candidatus Latescibacterota bacterium]|nr:MAG: preprotein translocase subunit SecG [Candidatus Latescibacterota bacterium]
MFTVFIAIHVIICVCLILVVLLQSGRGGGLAGAFGGGTAQTFFGGRGAATFLSKATAWLAIGFMLMSILLALLSSRTGATGEGLLQQRARQRASQVQLPPSSTPFNPAAALDSLEGSPPTESIGEPVGAEEGAAGDTTQSP